MKIRVLIFIFTLFTTSIIAQEDARFYSRMLAGETLEISVATQGNSTYNETITISCNEKGYVAEYRIKNVNGTDLQKPREILLNREQLEMINQFEKSARSAQQNPSSKANCATQTTFILQMKGRFFHFTDNSCSFTAFHQMKEKLIGNNS